MAAVNFTPISLYYSTTAAAVPSAGNLVAGELALNTVDEKLYFKNSAGTVKLLAANITPIANGGTGQTTASAAFNALSPITTTGDLILGNGTNSATRLAIGSNGSILTSNGTTASWTAAPAAGVTSFQTSLSGLTPSTSTTGAVTLAGTLGTSSGGTNLTSFTSGGVVYASSTSALATGSALYFDGTNLGVGTTQAITGSKVSVENAGFSAGSSANTSQTNLLLSGYGYRSGATTYGNASVRSTYNNANNSASLEFYTDPNGGSPTERVRIDPYGNVLVGGTAGRGTTTGTAHLDLFDGTAPAGTLTNGVSLYSSSGDLKFMDAAGNAYSVGYRNIPQSGSSKTTSYTLTTADVGEYILLGASGAIVIPDATFATGDVVSIFNNTGSTATITCSITTAYIAGTFTDKATMTLAAAGVATILFITGTTCVVSGNVT